MEVQRRAGILVFSSCAGSLGPNNEEQFQEEEGREQRKEIIKRKRGDQLQFLSNSGVFVHNLGAVEILEASKVRIVSPQKGLKTKEI